MNISIDFHKLENHLAMLEYEEIHISRMMEYAKIKYDMAVQTQSPEANLYLQHINFINNAADNIRQRKAVLCETLYLFREKHSYIKSSISDARLYLQSRFL